MDSETSLNALLPSKVALILAKSGICTVEGVRKAYPEGLMRIRGIGMLRLKQIETALFPGKSFTPKRIRSPIAHIKGSSLNGTLSPAAIRALGRGGITTVQQLREMSSEDLLRIKGLGHCLNRPGF